MTENKNIRNGKLSLYYLAKYTNYELLIDEFILTKGQQELLSSKKNKKKQRSIKFKIIRTKISYSIIFGILPIFPLLTYFQIADNLSSNLIPVDTIIFTGSLFFSLYFALQFFNFFLMAMLETGMIMTGRIFEWYETLPIPKDKIKKLIYLTIFRSFDIPIIVIIISFPLIMLIGTQNIIIFFICFGISVLNVLFSYNFLILFAGRINRVLDVHEINSKRSFRIRLFNIISYIIIIFGSMYVIQWAFSSIELFFNMFLNSEYPNYINLILSSIPYPFNPSYLISVLIVSEQVPLEIWISLFIGLGLLAILTWWGNSKALNMIEKLTFSKFRTIKESIPSKNLQDQIVVNIKTRTPLIAYLRKDLAVIGHDLKTLMAIITSILLSFLCSFYYNIGNLEKIDTPENLLFFNWVGILLYCPIITGILIFSLLTIENTGRSSLSSLPIVPRDQAKAKLLMLFIIQTIAVILPTVMYITTPHFLIIFISALGALPFIWMLLLITFEIKISLFGKIRNQYYIEDFKSENKMFKWTLIMLFQYILCFWIVSFITILYFFQNFVGIGLFLTSICILGYLTIIIVFERMFPQIPEVQIISLKILRPTIISKKLWLSVLSLLFLFCLGVILTNNLLQLISEPLSIFIFNNLYEFFYKLGLTHLPVALYLSILFLLQNIIFFILLIIIVPIFMGLPYGKQSIERYLNSIGLGWMKTILKNIKWVIVAVVLMFSMILIAYISGVPIFMEDDPIYRQEEILDFYFFLTISCIILWEETVFRGIILTILLDKYTPFKAIMVNTIIYLSYILILSPFINSFFYNVPYLEFIAVYLSYPILIFYILLFGIILAYLFTKTRNLLSVIILNFILYVFGFFPTVYF